METKQPSDEETEGNEMQYAQVSLQSTVGEYYFSYGKVCYIRLCCICLTM